MRKIKANGLKFNNKPMDRGPRFVVAVHGTQQPEKAREALLRLFAGWACGSTIRNPQSAIQKLKSKLPTAPA
jgi:hypothetical protein